MESREQEEGMLVQYTEEGCLKVWLIVLPSEVIGFHKILVFLIEKVLIYIFVVENFLIAILVLEIGIFKDS